MESEVQHAERPQCSSTWVQAWAMPCPVQEELRALVQLREQFIPHRDDDRRRLKQATLDRVGTPLLEHISYLRKQIRSVAKEIVQLRKRLDHDLAERLMAVPGIGEVTTASLPAPTGLVPAPVTSP